MRRLQCTVSAISPSRNFCHFRSGIAAIAAGAALRRCRAYRQRAHHTATSGEEHYDAPAPIPPGHPLRRPPCVVTSRRWRRCSAWRRSQESSAGRHPCATPANLPAPVRRRRASEAAARHAPTGNASKTKRRDIFCDYPIACLTHSAQASVAASSSNRPTICTPSGIPFGPLPAGTVTQGTCRLVQR